ncbi:cytochrome c [Devosia sp.]|jgi:mono/diheme cytochrome c family protein|uniref:c-type cytochrome n=1 Tax=Devosia sp. TaxID=1871048 RepID=UPI001AD24682|nr:cytochrome c [Devosia sp.]MBN9334530.1 cytochrome c [Devosia sp.]
MTISLPGFPSGWLKLALSAAILALGALAISPLASPVQAQDTAAAEIDPALVEQGFKVWKGQDCIGCHGWAGNGERIGENPTGPSLRALEYDAATLKEIILCGRPGTAMPSHDPRAYSDDRCYGMTKADLAGVNLLKGRDMSDAEADALVAYMMESMLGHPNQPSQEDCKAYYGGKPFCSKYPTAESQGF